MTDKTSTLTDEEEARLREIVREEVRSVLREADQRGVV